LIKEEVEFGHTRIGVNTGQAIVGNFGDFDRFDYTAMGDAMNTAARLESLNMHIGTRI
jgi:adenylate cyclase